MPSPGIDVPNCVASAISNAVSPAHFSFAAGVPAGDMVSVFISDNWGYGAIIDGVSDTKGNVYQASIASDGTVWHYYSFITTALTAADSLIVTFHGVSPWPDAYVTASAFENVVALRGVGAIEYDHLAVNATYSGAVAGDLAVGYATFFEASSLNNPGAPWVPFLNSVTVPHSEVVGDYQVVAAPGSLLYDPTPNPSGSGGFDEGFIVTFVPGASGGGGGGGGGGGITTTTGIVDAALAGVASPFTTPVLRDVPVGSLLLIFVGDGFGYNNTLTGVTDSKGNSYELDVATNQADGDGSVYIARSTVTTPLVAGADHVSLAFTDGSWPHAYAYGVAFVGATALDIAGTPVGRSGSGSIATSVAAAAGDVAVGFACYQGAPVTNDAAWTQLYHGGDSNDHMLISWKIASGGVLSYTTSTSGGGFAAAVAVAYRASPQPLLRQLAVGTPEVGVIGS